MKKQEPNFDEFPRADYEAWKEAASELLKGEDPEERLKWSALPGLDLKAYYDQSDLRHTGYLKNMSQTLTGESWTQYERVVIQNETEANQHARAALMNGCNGILFKGNLKNINTDKLFDGILLKHCYIALEHEGEPVSIGSLPENLKGFGKNIIASFPSFKNLVIESSDGENIITQSAGIIRSVITHIEKGNPTTVFSNLVIFLRPGNNFFPEIARFRALRLLLSKLANHCGSEYHKIHIHSEPLPGTTESDHLLKQTTTGLACLIGGTDSITFHPGESGWAGNGAHRISRNIGNLIRHEAKLDIVKDFSSGSYFIEALTDQVAKAIWDQVTK